MIKRKSDLSKSMNPFIIVTAPHTLCDLSDHVRNCDLLAEYAAKSLYSRIPYPKTLLLSDHYRSEVDLNRKPSRNTSFRKKLTHLMQNLYEQGYEPVFVLDIHSVEDGAWDTSEIYLLDEFTIDTPYVNDLSNLLQSYGVIVNHYQGQHNDIMEEARSNGFISILIEFNESLPHRRVDQITPLIVQWIDETIHQ